MAQKNTVEILIKATSDQAQQAFKKLEATISTSTSGMRKSLANFNENSKVMYNNLNELSKTVTGFDLGNLAGIAGVGLAIKKTSEFIKESVGITAEYGRTVLEMSQKIGASAEETSRLIQVADDFKISVGEMEGAMRIALRNGFQPSIENLAQLSDRIKGINDPTQRAAELTKIFGRNWESLLPMLLAGGDAIRTNAAAISDSLIMTDDSIAATEEYRLAVDQLGDSWTGFKMIIGNQAIPALTDLLDIVNQFAPVIELLDNGLGNNVVSVGALAYAVALAENKFNPLAVSMDDVTKAAGQMEEAHKKAREELEKVSGRTPREMQLLQQNTEGAAEAFVDLENNVEASSEILGIYAKALDKTELSQSTQNRLLLQYAESIGAVGAQTLIVNEDLAMMQQAVEAGIVPIDDLGKALVLASEGQMIFDDATRDAIEAQLKSKGAVEENTDALAKQKPTVEELAASYQRVQDIIAKTAEAQLSLAEAFKEEITTEEIARAAIDQIQKAYEDGLITAQQMRDAQNDLSVAYGLTTEQSLAQAAAILKGNEVFSQFLARTGDVDKATEMFKAWNDAVAAGVDPMKLWGQYGLEMTVVNGQIVGQFPSMTSALDMAADSIYGVNDAAMQTTPNVSETGIAITNMGLAAQQRRIDMMDLAGGIDEVNASAGAAKKPVSELKKLIDGLKSKTITINVNTNYAKLLSETYDKGRQHGGPVAPGQSYIVGEAGPELFMPRQSGMIIPNAQTPMPFTPGAKTTGGATTTSNITISNSFPIQRANDQWDMRDLARLVAAEIARNPQLR